MAVTTSTALLIGAAVAAVGTAATVYTSSQAAKAAGQKTSNTYTNYGYDDQGNVVIEGVTHTSSSGKTSYYKPRELTQNEKDEIVRRNTLIKQYQENLISTPSENLDMYKQYSDTVRSQLQRGVDEEYNDTLKQQKEDLEKRGMTGSKAYADIMSQLAEDKGKLDLQVAERATLAGNDMAESDRQFWLSALSEAEAGKKSGTLLGMEAENNANRTNLMYGANARANQELSSLASGMRTNSLMNSLSSLGKTATGLSYLYGMNTGGGAGASNFSLSQPSYSYAFQNDVPLYSAMNFD